MPRRSWKRRPAGGLGLCSSPHHLQKARSPVPGLQLNRRPRPLTQVQGLPAPGERGLEVPLALQVPRLARQPARPALAREGLLQQAAQHHDDPGRGPGSAGRPHAVNRTVASPACAAAAGSAGGPAGRGSGQARAFPQFARAQGARRLAVSSPARPAAASPGARRRRNAPRHSGGGPRGPGLPHPQPQAAVWLRQAGPRRAEELGTAVSYSPARKASSPLSTAATGWRDRLRAQAALAPSAAGAERASPAQPASGS